MTAPEQAAPTTEGGGPAIPFTATEFDVILGTIWEGLDEDPTRFNDLLGDACAFIGTLAVRADVDPNLAALAAQCLRGMEQRALWGPALEQEDHL